MFFLRKETNKVKPREITPVDRLIDFFESTKNNEDFSFNAAIDLFQKIDSAATSEDQLIQFCVEDIIFSSLYATIYEELLVTCRDHLDLAVPLIEEFLKNSDEREQKIITQAQQHYQYLENNGECAGCGCCENHADVTELLPHLQRRDLNFFIKLYVGMQTIQMAFEQLIYDTLPNDLTLLDSITKEDVLAFREYIFNFTEEQLRR